MIILQKDILGLSHLLMLNIYNNFQNKIYCIFLFLLFILNYYHDLYILVLKVMQEIQFFLENKISQNYGQDSSH